MTQREFDARLRRLDSKPLGMPAKALAERLGVPLAVLETFQGQLQRERRQGLAACRSIEAWNATHPRRTRRGNRQ